MDAFVSFLGVFLLSLDFRTLIEHRFLSLIPVLLTENFTAELVGDSCRLAQILNFIGEGFSLDSFHGLNHFVSSFLLE